MNSFNRLSYTYRFIFNRKILIDYNRILLKNFVFSKKMPIFVIQKRNNKTYNYGKRNQRFRKKKFQNYNHS